MIHNNIELNFLAGVQVENDIYFSAWNMNGLFLYNPQTEECNFLKCFPGEENWGLHSEAVLYKNSIWFIPRASERIAIVELDRLEIKYLELPKYACRKKEHIPPIRMKACHKNGERFLWIIPFAYRLFLKIDMDKRMIINEEDWGGDGYAASVGIRYHDKLWIYVNALHELRVIDTISGERTVKKVGDANNFYLGIQELDNWILLFQKEPGDKLLLINCDTYAEKETQLGESGQWYYEYQALTAGGDLLLIPYTGKKYVLLGGKNSRYFVKKTGGLEVEENVYCSTKLIYNDELWFLSHVTEKPIICYQDKKPAMKYRRISIEREKYNMAIAECIEKYGNAYVPLNQEKVIYEHNILLDTFLLYLKDVNIGTNVNKNKQIGKDIYKAAGQMK